MVFSPLKTVLSRAAAHGAPASFATAGREALEAKVRDSDAIYHTWDQGWNLKKRKS